MKTIFPRRIAAIGGLLTALFAHAQSECADYHRFNCDRSGDTRFSVNGQSKSASVQVGVPTPDMALPDIPMIELFGRGGAIKPSWYGDCLPTRDFPTLVDLFLQGRFPLDRFVTETIPLEGVEDAFHKMEQGEVLRSVVTID